MPSPTMPERPAPVGSWWTALAIGLALALLAKRPLADGRVPRQAAAVPPNGGLRVAQPSRSEPTAAPSGFRKQDWWSIGKRVVGQISENRILAVAASVTFYCLLALFPALAALVSIYGLIADPNTIANELSSLATVLPGGAIDIIVEQVKRIAAKPHGSLGFGVALGLLTALWSANAGTKAVFDALNIVYGEKEKRNFFVLNAISLLCTLSALVIILLALAAVVAIPVALSMFGTGGGLDLLIGIARWPILLLLIAGTFTVLYRIGPSRTPPRWRWLTWGSGIAAVAWVVASMGFSFYVARFGNYDATYGSLGAAIGFMTWIWISATIVLIGAEINAEMEHQTPEDTTTGPRKPAGARGAAMADTVAK